MMKKPIAMERRANGGQSRYETDTKWTQFAAAKDHPPERYHRYRIGMSNVEMNAIKNGPTCTGPVRFRVDFFSNAKMKNNAYIALSSSKLFPIKAQTPSMISLKGQTALITGGSRGIGAATAIMFAKAGANVALTYQKNRNAADSVLRTILASGSRGIALKGSIENERDCRRFCRETAKLFGSVDLLVNSAGIWEYGEIGKMSLKQWQKTIDINLTGTFNMCNAVVPMMKTQKYGRIINVSSTAGQRGEAYHSHYAASKGGVISFTKSLAPELISHGIWVNCVAPGWVETDMTAAEMKKTASRKEILDTIPRKKVASAEEIAGPILFLASELANNVVGEILNVNGGSVLCG